VLEVTPRVATLGAESAVYDWLVDAAMKQSRTRLCVCCYKGYYGSGSPYSFGDGLDCGRHSEYDDEWHFQHNIY